MTKYCDVIIDGQYFGSCKYLTKKEAGKKMNNRTVNWTEIFSNLSKETVRGFANGNVSGRQLYDIALTYGGSAEVRNLLRTRGVSEARQLARKALSRR